MNLRQLEAFRATLRTGSVTAAGEYLKISQPSVSRLIGALESSVGFLLFSRCGRGLVPTVEARRFQSAVESMFIGIDRLEETAAAIRNSVHGEVLLGIPPALSYQVTPDAVARLHSTRPDLNIVVRINNTAQLLDAVVMQQLDIAVVNTHAHHSLESVHVIFEKELVYQCLLPSAHPLAMSKNPIDLKKIDGADFVAFDASGCAQMSSNFELVGDNTGKARLLSSSTPLAAGLARATGKLAIVDPYTAITFKSIGGVVTRPTRQKFTSRLMIVTRGLDTLTLAANELADVLIDELKMS